jgi:hypothetical protein
VKPKVLTPDVEVFGKFLNSKATWLLINLKKVVISSIFNKFVIFQFLLSNFLALSIVHPSIARAVTVGTGNCAQSFDSSSGVVVTTSGNNCVITISYSGEMRTWTIPSGGLTNISFSIKGAAGGGTYPDASYGASFAGTILSLSGMDSVYITVGGIGGIPTGGFGGSAGGNGGNNGSRGGGGSTDIRVGSSSSSDRKLVAGGGGGASGVSAVNKNGSNASGVNGGAGGNTGTQSAGNCLGTTGSNSSNGGSGGKAAPSVAGFESTTCRNAGGGGGGYAGGGGAGNSNNGSNSTGGKGGSGSSYWAAGFAEIATDCGSGCSFWDYGNSNTNTDFTKYTNNTNGSLVLTFSSIDTTAPSFTSSSSFSVAENIAISSAAATIKVSESATVTISSGADASLFTISNSDTVTALIKFKASPNYESPSDSGGNNVYDLVLTATDPSSNAGTQTITITVTDVVDTSSFNSFSLSGTPSYRTVVTITANVTVAAKVTFRAKNVIISGCKNKTASGSGSSFATTCSWRPSARGAVTLTATAVPTSGSISSSTATPLNVMVGNRSGGR